MRLKELVSKYGLASHPEGGYYKEVYRSGETLTLPRGERSSNTTIFYLLNGADFSAWHRICSDETWCHIEGSATLKIHMIDERGIYSYQLLGKGDGESPLYTVSKNVWFAVEVVNGDIHGEDYYAFVTCMVAPGFHWDDFRLGSDHDQLIRQCPQHTAIINQLSRDKAVVDPEGHIATAVINPKLKEIKTIAILIAMPDEALPIIERLGLKKNNKLGFLPEYGLEAYHRETGGESVYLILNGKDEHNRIAGIGTTAATINAMQTIQAIRPDVIISVGVAGGYADTDAVIGDVYIGSELVFHDRDIPLEGLRSFGKGRYCGHTLPGFSEEHGLKNGIIASGNQFMSDAKRKALEPCNRPVVEDMECAAIAKVVDKFSDITMIALKSVVNLTGLTLEQEAKASKDFDSNTKEAMDNLSFVVERVVDYVLGKTPQQIDNPTLG